MKRRDGLQKRSGSRYFFDGDGDDDESDDDYDESDDDDNDDESDHYCDYDEEPMHCNEFTRLKNALRLAGAISSSWPRC